MTTATPKKLRNGSWGALVQDARVQEGSPIQVTTQAGKTWTTTVGRVIWRGDGVAICTTHAPRRTGDDTQRCYHGHTQPKAGCRDCFDLWD